MEREAATYILTLSRFSARASRSRETATGGQHPQSSSPTWPSRHRPSPGWSVPRIKGGSALKNGTVWCERRVHGARACIERYASICNIVVFFHEAVMQGFTPQNFIGKPRCGACKGFAKTPRPIQGSFDGRIDERKSKGWGEDREGRLDSRAPLYISL
jgi:hypothetical protein